MIRYKQPDLFQILFIFNILDPQPNLKILDKILFKFILIAILLWQLPIVVSAQEKYVSGKIIISNDTISGFIRTNPEYTNKTQVVFSKTPNKDDEETFYPDQISKFIIDSKEFVTKPVEYYGKEELNFIRRVVYGFYNLYEGYNSDGSTLFYIQAQDGKVVHLPKETTSSWLIQYFSDCEIKRSRTYYDKISLSNLVSKYSQCKQPELFVYQEEKYKSSITLGVKLGANISMMKFIDEINPYKGISFNSGWGFQGGLVFNIELNRYLQVEFDLLISQIQGEFDYSADTVSYKFKRTDLKIPILFRYVIKSDFGFEPYINLGLDFRVLLKDKFQFTHSTGELEFDPAKGVAGLIVGIGSFITINRDLSLIVDLRYSYSKYLAHSGPRDKYSLKNQVISFSTGILF